jgi:hypothetical protein
VAGAEPGTGPTPPSLLARWVDGCLTVVTWATVAVIVLAVGLFLWFRHTMARPAVPDTVAFARAFTARHADAVDSKWIDQQFAQLTRLVPQLTSSGRSVFDVCSPSNPDGPFFGSGAAAYGFTCRRTDTRYYAFAGPGAGHVRQLEQVLTRLGWGMFTTGSPAGTPAALPVVDASPVTTSSGPMTGKTGLTFSWAERGIQLNLARDTGAVPAVVAPGGNTYIVAVQRPSLKGILSHLTAERPHLFIVSLSVIYAQRLPSQ